MNRWCLGWLRCVPLLLLVAMGSFPGTLLAQRQMADGNQRAVLLTAAREIMLAARYCGLVTLDESGHACVRTMDPFAPDKDMIVRLATNAQTRKVEQIRRDARVALYYFEPSGPSYVTVTGRARLIKDPLEKSRWWKKDWAQFYDDSNRGDDYLLIEVAPTRLEIVSIPHGIASQPKSWNAEVVEFP